jgi:hypothetical protein
MRSSPFVRLALAAAFAAGCSPFYGPPRFGNGDIYVSWTFSGGSCAETPAVAQVMVSIPNDLPIKPNTFACQVGNPPNQLVIQNFAPGSYLVNLTGLDSGGNVIWLGSQTVVVNGSVAATIDLKPSGPTSTLNLSWSFAPAVGSFFPPCTAFGSTDPDRIDSVALYVDGAGTAAQTYDCTDGTGSATAATPFLSPGSHILQLVAYQAGLSYPFAQSAPVPVNVVANTPSSQAFSFAWLVGGTGVAWTYPTANACASTVSSVTAAFTGPASTGYSASGLACETAVAPFKHLQTLDGGVADNVTYSLTVNAIGPTPPGSVAYTGTNPAVTIEPGHFYDGTVATVVTVPLN